MFGKLMKYDMRCWLRRLGLLWIAIAVFSVFNGFLMRGIFNWAENRGGLIFGLVGILPPVALGILHIAVWVLLIYFVCERFYKGLLGDEGYLMFTLPASVSRHILSKGLSSLIIEVLSVAVAIVSSVVMLVIYQPAEFAEGLQRLVQMWNELHVPVSVPLLILEVVVLLLVDAASEIMKIYLAIAVGHLAARRRRLWSVLSWFGISILEYIVLGWQIKFAADWDLFRPLADTNWGVQFTDGQMMVQGAGMIAALLCGMILAEGIVCVVYFLITRFILTKKLNLE